MQRFDLLAHQVKLQVRVDGADFGRIVRVAVMTLGENGHRIDMAHFYRFGKLFGVKIGADVRTIRRGMKIEMQLSEAKVSLAHDASISVTFFALEVAHSRCSDFGSYAVYRRVCLN